jgi:hypothetical protein
MTRTEVTLEELFEILKSQYLEVRPRACGTCVTPIPIRRTAADDVSANWFITNPVACPLRCDVLLAEVATRLMSEYELVRSVPSSRPWGGRR